MVNVLKMVASVLIGDTDNFKHSFLVVTREITAYNTTFNAIHTRIMLNFLSDTTRERRENEVDGFDYHFMNCSVREFRQQCDQGLFIEAGMFHDNGYGTKLQTVVASMEKVNNYEPVREIHVTDNLGSVQVRHKPGCTVTEDDQRLEILDLESKEIVLSV